MLALVIVDLEAVRQCGQLSAQSLSARMSFGL